MKLKPNEKGPGYTIIVESDEEMRVFAPCLYESHLGVDDSFEHIAQRILRGGTKEELPYDTYDDRPDNLSFGGPRSGKVEGGGEAFSKVPSPLKRYMQTNSLQGLYTNLASIPRCSSVIGPEGNYIQSKDLDAPTTSLGEGDRGLTWKPYIEQGVVLFVDSHSHFEQTLQIVDETHNWWILNGSSGQWMSPRDQNGDRMLQSSPSFPKISPAIISDVQFRFKYIENERGEESITTTLISDGDVSKINNLCPSIIDLSDHIWRVASDEQKGDPIFLRDFFRHVLTYRSTQILSQDLSSYARIIWAQLTPKEKKDPESLYKFITQVLNITEPEAMKQEYNTLCYGKENFRLAPVWIGASFGLLALTLASGGLTLLGLQPLDLGFFPEWIFGGGPIVHLLAGVLALGALAIGVTAAIRYEERQQGRQKFSTLIEQQSRVEPKNFEEKILEPPVVSADHLPAESRPVVTDRKTKVSRIFDPADQDPKLKRDSRYGF